MWPPLLATKGDDGGRAEMDAMTSALLEAPGTAVEVAATGLSGGTNPRHR